MTNENVSVRQKIEEKIRNEKRKEGEKKLEVLIKEINEAKAVVEEKEQKAEEIISDYDL